MTPSIVVLAYNRPDSLCRLLTSLKKAAYPPDTRLVISIDAGGSNGRHVHQIAQETEWPFGDKEIIAHDQHLGLINHVFFGGDLSQKYGSIILLEDDLFVSPMFYHFATQALDTYGHDPAIAGISLNALWFNGYTHQPFVPYLDDNDVFFLQVSWYQGMAYTAAQWADFMAWRTTAVTTITPEDGLHEIFTTFPSTDWFPFMMKYLVQRGRYYVLPRQSLTTHFGDAGTHFIRPTPFFQVPLQTERRQFRLHPMADSLAVYDAFQEILPDRLNRLTNQFCDYDYAVDLYATKSRRNLTAPYVLTTQRCHNPLASFGQVMWPHEANVTTAVAGQNIHFAATSNLKTGLRDRWATQRQNHQYFTRQRQLGMRERLKFGLSRIIR